MISLLLPTRQRPHNLVRLVESINATKTTEIVELVTYIDTDDRTYDDLTLDITWKRVYGPRHIDGKVNLSVMWNECYKHSDGDILMHCGDDIVFRTEGWDFKVASLFDRTPDKILFAFGNDGIQDANDFGTHGFIHNAWVEAVGYFCPPYFVSDYNDTFFNDVAKAVGRHVKIPIYTEHMHYCAGKADIDQNTAERLRRHADDDPRSLYYSDKVQGEIREAAARLQLSIDLYAGYAKLAEDPEYQAESQARRARRDKNRERKGND